MSKIMVLLILNKKCGIIFESTRWKEENGVLDFEGFGLTPPV